VPLPAPIAARPSSGPGDALVEAWALCRPSGYREVQSFNDEPSRIAGPPSEAPSHSANRRCDISRPSPHQGSHQ
jgi:hypothetical protein